MSYFVSFKTDLYAFFSLIRWNNLIILVLCQYMSRVFLVGPSAQWSVYLFEWPFFLIMLTFVLITSAGYIINDYYDIKIDIINKPQRVVVGNKISKRKSLYLTIVLDITGIIVGLMVSIAVGIFSFLFALVLWLYASFLKRLPFVGNFLVALLTAGSIFVLSLHYRGDMTYLYIFSTFALLICLIRELIKDIEDVQGDRAFNCRTLPIVLGIRKTKRVIYSIVILFFIFVFWVNSLTQSLSILIYFLLLGFFMGYFICLLSSATTKKDFSRLSAYAKAIMVSGVLMMILFG